MLERLLKLIRCSSTNPDILSQTQKQLKKLHPDLTTETDFETYLSKKFDLGSDFSLSDRDMFWTRHVNQVLGIDIERVVEDMTMGQKLFDGDFNDYLKNVPVSIKDLEHMVLKGSMLDEEKAKKVVVSL